MNAESIKSLEGYNIAWVEEAQTLSARSLALLRPTIRALKIEVWDDADRHIEEVIALASDFASACGAYDKAVKRRPGSSSRCVRRLG